MAEPQDVVWNLDSGEPKEESIRWGHTGATWRIALNRSCAAAMRPIVNLRWPRTHTVLMYGMQP